MALTSYSQSLTDSALCPLQAAARLDEAWSWLCHTRENAPDHADIWHLRYHWAHTRTHLLEWLLRGDYRLTPMLVVGKKKDALALWSAQDALVLKWVALCIAPQLTIPARCEHVKGHGGGRTSVGRMSQALRTGAYPWVCRTDVKGYYASMNKQLLLQGVFRQVTQPVLQALIRQYVHYTVEDGGEFHTPDKGIARGCALSPLMGALYLSEMDEHFTDQAGIYYARYMDDVVILARTRWQLRRHVRTLNQFFNAGQVEQHPDKTFIGKTERGFDWMGAQMSDAGVEGIAQRAKVNHRERCQRLYERFRRCPAEGRMRMLAYRKRWTIWAMALMGAAASFPALSAVGQADAILARIAEQGNALPGGQWGGDNIRISLEYVPGPPPTNDNTTSIGPHPAWTPNFFWPASFINGMNNARYSGTCSYMVPSTYTSPIHLTFHGTDSIRWSTPDTLPNSGSLLYQPVHTLRDHGDSTAVLGNTFNRITCNNISVVFNLSVPLGSYLTFGSRTNARLALDPNGEYIAATLGIGGGSPSLPVPTTPIKTTAAPNCTALNISYSNYNFGRVTPLPNAQCTGVDGSSDCPVTNSAQGYVNTLTLNCTGGGAATRAASASVFASSPQAKPFSPYPNQSLQFTNDNSLYMYLYSPSAWPSGVFSSRATNAPLDIPRSNQTMNDIPLFTWSIPASTSGMISLPAVVLTPKLYQLYNKHWSPTYGPKSVSITFTTVVQ